jgi:hypothetical protein
MVASFSLKGGFPALLLPHHPKMIRKIMNDESRKKKKFG